MSYFRKFVDIFEQSTPNSIFGRRSKKMHFDLNFMSSEYSILLLPRYTAQCVKPVIKSQVSIFSKTNAFNLSFGSSWI